MTNSVTNVKPEDVKSYLGNDEYLIVDVREPFEYAEGHVPTAVNIPLGGILNNLDKIDKSKKVVCICRSGVRSLDASNKLASKGYDVYNMLGGVLDWTYDFER